MYILLVYLCCVHVCMIGVYVHICACVCACAHIQLHQLGVHTVSLHKDT